MKSSKPSLEEFKCIIETFYVKEIDDGILYRKLYWGKSVEYETPIKLSLDVEGYSRVKISIKARKKTFKTHNVIYFLRMGVWPEYELDHRDGNKQNNFMLNLRPATTAQNTANKPKASGLPPGVFKTGHKFVAQIYAIDEIIWLGSFHSVEKAYEAYKRAYKILHKKEFEE